MDRKRRIDRAGLLCLAMTGSFCILIGCSKTASTPDTTPSGNAPTVASNAAPPPAVFNTAGCTRCHSIGNAGGGAGGGRRRQIDLSHTGGNPIHTPQWIAEFIKNPQSKKAGVRMPAFEGKISETDLQALSTYLAGLK